MQEIYRFLLVFFGYVVDASNFTQAINPSAEIYNGNATAILYITGANPIVNTFKFEFLNGTVGVVYTPNLSVPNTQTLTVNSSKTVAPQLTIVNLSVGMIVYDSSEKVLCVFQCQKMVI